MHAPLQDLPFTLRRGITRQEDLTLMEMLKPKAKTNVIDFRGRCMNNSRSSINLAAAYRNEPSDLTGSETPKEDKRKRELKRQVLEELTRLSAENSCRGSMDEQVCAQRKKSYRAAAKEIICCAGGQQTMSSARVMPTAFRTEEIHTCESVSDRTVWDYPAAYEQP